MAVFRSKEHKLRKSRRPHRNSYVHLKPFSTCCLTVTSSKWLVVLLNAQARVGTLVLAAGDGEHQGLSRGVFGCNLWKKVGKCAGMWQDLSNVCEKSCGEGENPSPEPSQGLLFKHQLGEPFKRHGFSCLSAQFKNSCAAVTVRAHLRMCCQTGYFIVTTGIKELPAIHICWRPSGTRTSAIGQLGNWAAVFQDL